MYFGNACLFNKRVFQVNPNFIETKGARCYPGLRAIPRSIDRVVAVTHPSVAVELVRQCAECGVSQVWFHRAFGDGSVSDEAVKECKALGIQCVVGGCPLMSCEPVDS